MITKASKQHFTLRIFPEYGDAAILHALFTSELWKALFTEKKLAVFVLNPEIHQLSQLLCFL